MRRPVASVALAVMLVACSPSPSPAPPYGSGQPARAPANAMLGSAQWYAWVDQALGIDDRQGHGPDRGSTEWNQAVQKKLGQEAPQSQLGSPEWQQSVDALLRTRVPSSR